jgi:hypothetical protein
VVVELLKMLQPKMISPFPHHSSAGFNRLLGPPELHRNDFIWSPTLPFLPLFAYFIHGIGDGRLDEHVRINEGKPWYYLDVRFWHIILRKPLSMIM